MADWPLTSDLGPLGALPTAPRLARGFIGVVLNGWGLDSLIETTELVVSELTTNVVQAVTGTDGSLRYDAEGKLPLLWVRLSSDRFRLMIEVWDTLPAALGAPAMRHPDQDEDDRRKPPFLVVEEENPELRHRAPLLRLGLPAEIVGFFFHGP